MGAVSLFRQAKKYRSLARGINDERALAVLEQMACELERRARIVEGESARHRASSAHPRRKHR